MAVSAQSTKIHMAIAAWDWPSYFDPATKAKGIRLTWAKYKRPSPETEPVHSKASGLYMICTISKHRAEKKGYADAMMLDFIVDYLRLIISGNMNTFEIEARMDEEIETHESESEVPANSLALVGDSLPAFGIVAAVMGVSSALSSEATKAGRHSVSLAASARGPRATDEGTPAASRGAARRGAVTRR
jgi:hypothetical protein